MNTFKKAGVTLLAMQCSFNITTVLLFLFAPQILRPNAGSFSTLARILVFGGGFLALVAVGIFACAAQKEQTHEKATTAAPEGGKVAQRDLTLATVGFVSEMVTLYWIL